MAKEEKAGSVPQPEPLKEGEVLPGVSKDKDWLAEREPAPQAEPLKEGEVLPGVKGKDWEAEREPAPAPAPLKEGEVLPGVKEGVGEEAK